MSGLKPPHRLIASSFLLLAFSAFAADEPTKPDQKTTATLSFGGVDYMHRWSKNGQNEFTPKGQEDLAKWQDMITINVHEGVVNGGQLADLANRVPSYRGKESLFAWGRFWCSTHFLKMWW